MALKGAGNLFFRTNDLDLSSIGQNLMSPLCLASFELEFDDTELQARCLEGGIRQLKAAAITESIATLRLTFEVVDFQQLAFAFDEIPQTSTGVVLERLKRATVTDGGGVGEIIDADITAINEALTDDGILAYRESRNATLSPDYLLKVPGAPAGTEEFQVDTGATRLVFDSANIGAAVSYVIPQAYSSVEAIGQEQVFNTFGSFSFIGEVSSTEAINGWLLVVPQIGRVSKPSFSVTGELSELVVETRPVLAAGERSTFKIFNLDAATI